MVIRGIDGELYWQDPETGMFTLYVISGSLLSRIRRRLDSDAVS